MRDIKWEYKIVQIRDLFFDEKLLNKYGDEGYELIRIDIFEGEPYCDKEYRLILKRLKDAERE